MMRRKSSTQNLISFFNFSSGSVDNALPPLLLPLATAAVIVVQY
jgi:hypothetical protein